MWRAGSGAFEELFTEDPLVGIDPLSVYHEKSLVVSSGDVIVMYTDGVNEAADERGERYGMDRLRDAIARVVGKSSGEIVDAVIGDVVAFAQPEAIKDDITVMVCKVL